MSRMIFSYEGLAERLGVSVGTLKNLYSRNAANLPPAIRIPGCRGPQWTDELVSKWLEAHIQQPEDPVIAPSPPPAATTDRKRGRPRIYQGLAKQSSRRQDV